MILEAYIKTFHSNFAVNELFNYLSYDIENESYDKGIGTNIGIKFVTNIGKKTVYLKVLVWNPLV